MKLCDFILIVHVIVYGIHGEEPTQSPTHNLIGSTANDNDLFVIPNISLPYNQALDYCTTHYHGLANIYDPKENDNILQLVNLNFITHAFIAYYKTDSQWQWQSNVSSNPMLWLQSPLAQITSNIEYAHTKCIFTSRYGWQYTPCTESYNFVCETREHSPQFNQSGPYMMPNRKLKFDYARSMCRAQGYDLATIYEEEEYHVVQSLCKDHTNNKTNCWIGYERGVLNDNEWQWVQDLPTAAMPINALINIDLWSISPWQYSTADIYCQATLNVSISYSSNGEDYIGNTSGVFMYNEAVHYRAENVLHDSNVLFKVQTKAGALPGLKCTIHFEDDIYNTQVDDALRWSIVSFTDDYTDDLHTIVEAHTTAGNQQTPPSTMDEDAQWLWNYVYKNKSYVTKQSAVTFKFVFEQVRNVQNRPSDDCASISYYPPYKWKTSNCQSEQHFVCNARDHKPVFAVSSDEKFALLTDRTLTCAQSASLCQNIYGYGLAIVYSYYEFTEIDGMLHDNEISDAWIGLYHDNHTFVNSNNLDNHYGWSTKREFIFDTWTSDVFSFIDPPPNDETCVQQIQNTTQWITSDCNTTSYAICNIDAHSPNFTASQLGAFYLLDEPQNYLDGEEMCRDYVGIRSKGATIYHPMENERAKWLCSNATNGKGCFIGYNEIEYNNQTKLRWRNGALIDVFEYPWFGNPWLNISYDEYDEANMTDSVICTAIMPSEEDPEQWGWKVVDCDMELNMLCDSGDDHAQCWMLQNCAQCALRSDCQWCGDQCQLTDEICYADEVPIQQEFGCPDFDPIINITYQENVNYTYTVNISMCSSTAPEDVPTTRLNAYVNTSNCVLQQQVVEFYVISDWQAAMYGNYDILGKVIELRQSSRNPGGEEYHNITTFEDSKVCDVKIYHGYVRSITCDKNGAGYKKNITQFDMLHDVLRYLLPRLQSRLFEGWDIPQRSLFGYSTMQRVYDPSSGDHSILKKFTKKSMKHERYANATSDLLWEHRHLVEAGDTEIKTMNFSMIHVFAHLPHHDEAQRLQLFTWCGYELTLLHRDGIKPKKTTALRKDLYALSETERFIKNYTIEEWRGIRPGNFAFDPNKASPKHEEEAERRRLGILEGVEKFCQTYNNITGFRGEVQFEIWGLNVWVSQVNNGLRNGKSFLQILEASSGYHGALSASEPFVVIPGFLELDLGFKVHFGFGWDYKTQAQYLGSNPTVDEDGDEFYDAKSDNNDVSLSDKEASSPNMKNCPFSFQVMHQALPSALSKHALAIVVQCCGVFADSQRDCHKTLKQAHADANKCLLDNGFCQQFKDDGKKPQSVLTGGAIYEWDGADPPNLNSIIRFVMFFKNEGWDNIVEDIKKIMSSFVWEQGVNNLCNKNGNPWAKTLIETASIKLKSYDVNTLIDFAKQIGKIMERARYIKYKRERCERSSGPVVFDFDIWFHLGLYNPTLKGLCKVFAGAVASADSFAQEEEFEDANERRRRLTAMNLQYPIIPEIPLPCIPIAPPWLMFCPHLFVGTEFGIGFDPEFDGDEVGLEITPRAAFDIDASLSLKIGILIFEAEIILGVRINVVAIELPIDIAVNVQQFGISGDIGIDIKVLEFTIYLRFKLCVGFWIFRFCPLNIVLWQFSVTAYEYEKRRRLGGLGGLAQWGMGSHADQSRLPANIEQAQTKLRFYWAFKDSETAYNHEYDYGWENTSFTDFSYDEWAQYLLDLTSCQIKEYSITRDWYILKDSPEMINITDPYACKYNMDGFDKLLVTEITVQWYSTLGMKTCFGAKIKPMFREKYCCNFALEVYDEIHKLSGIKFDLSSYKMIVMDLNQNWAHKCAQFYLNVEEQIDETPYYDDCSDEGWRIAKGLTGEYRLGFHNIFGEHALSHYNHKPTCLNWYNSSIATKTTRTFEILFPYDFLMIGMRFWAEAGTQHTADDWYGIRIANESNYYWMSNVDSTCQPTEKGYSNWYHVGLDLQNVSDSTAYCYTDVLMYIDPMIHIGKKYRFDLEIIANVPEEEFWGFSSLVMNTFDNGDMCVTNIFPVFELVTTYSGHPTYEYYGLKDVPSLYYGYVLFDISFDYRFHDISALISLSTSDSNATHWVINFDAEQSGIWIRSGSGAIPSTGILTLNSALASTIVDTDDNDEIVYTKMHIQWNANSDQNYMRVGFGHVLGENIIASVDYDKFKFSTQHPLKYVGFARSLGSSIPSVQWKIYKHNMPPFCLSTMEKHKVHQTQNYKQMCIEDESGTTNLVIYDLVTPDCIYYTSNLSNPLKYTFTIHDPHDYVMLNMKLFADFDKLASSWGVCSGETVVAVYYAEDGDHFEALGNATMPNSINFDMTSVSHLSKLRFVVKHGDTVSIAYLSCILMINGLEYTSSDHDIAYWRIIKANANGKTIVNNVGGIDGRIWNALDDIHKNTVVFEFSFQNVYGANYIEIDIDGQPNDKTKVIPRWAQNLDRQVCESKDYYDGISNQFTVNCFGVLNATFEHLSQQETFSIYFTPSGVTQYGIGDIQLHYGLCRDILPLIQANIRYSKQFKYWSADELPSIASNYIFFMIKCELDSYESAESYISIGTDNVTDPRFVVRIHEHAIEIWMSVLSHGLFGDTLVAKMVNNTDTIINNERWAEFYIEWDKNLGFFRIGTGYILGHNVLLSIDFYELYSPSGIIINSVGIMHSNPDNIRDFNVITFHAAQTSEPKLCWTSELESVAEKTWINSKMEDVWLTGNQEPTDRIATQLSTSSIFNGPFLSGNSLSKTLATIYEHDYIQLSTRVFGFGAWDVVYPAWLNGLSIFFSESDLDSLLWFGTFLNDGGVTNARCDITEYKQWFSWSQPNSLNGLPLDILTQEACVYDVDLYIKHNSTHDPFFLSFIGELQQTKCDAVPQYDVALDASSGTNVEGYPLMLNASLHQNNYRYCHGLCNDVYECRAWMYNASGYCWLKTTADLHISRQGGYVTGLCDGEHVFDINSTCSARETLVRSGYKADTSKYLTKFALINDVNVSIKCESTGPFIISTSMDNGMHFRTNEAVNGNSADLTVHNISYASQIQFNVTNSGYLSKSNMYYGIEHTDHAHQFMHHTDSTLSLGTFESLPSSEDYIWKIVEPGLTGESGTVSLKSTITKGDFENVTTYITAYDGANSSIPLQLPTPMNGLTLNTDEVRVVCAGAIDMLDMTYAMNGVQFVSVLDRDHHPNATVYELTLPNVTTKSKMQFWVTNDKAPGLKCTIFTSLMAVSTSDDDDYWRIISATEGNTSIETTAEDVAVSDEIEQDAEWIWNDDCWSSNDSNSCGHYNVVFEFAFANVPLYTYEMSTFKLSSCTQSGKEDAYMIQGVGAYSDHYFTLNEDQSNLILDASASNTSCWYIRTANPGFGCIIDIDNKLLAPFTTNTDTSSTASWLPSNTATQDTYFDTRLNLSSYEGGTWIWDKTCLPVDSTECIDSSQATFTLIFKNIPGLSDTPSEDDCQAECEAYDGCEGWLYRKLQDKELYPQCTLKSDLPIDLVADEDYTTGLNIEANQCDCICGDCYPGNEYHYIYIENADQFKNPLYLGSTLYSYGCDFSLYKHESGDLVLRNLATGNTLNTITSTQLTTLESNASWVYPVRMILDNSILLIVDDELNSKHIYHKQCTLQEESESALSDWLDDGKLGRFFIPSEFSIQFVVHVDSTEDLFSNGMKIMTLASNDTTDPQTYFTFGWTTDGTFYIELNGVQHQVTGKDIKTLSKGKTHWTIKVSTSKLQIWAKGSTEVYQAFKLSDNNSTNLSIAVIPSTAYIIAPWNDDENTPLSYTGNVGISHICISDLPWKSYLTNKDEFDYAMRCWSGKYKNINRREAFISSFISDSGCATVTTSCHTSFGEDLEYIPYFDVLTENDDYNDPSCFTGKFADPKNPPINNKLCIMFKKCASPSQSLYHKSWGFADVNLTTSVCNNIVPHITRKISIEWDDEFNINDGTLRLNSESVYTIKNNFLIFSLRPIRFPDQGFGNRSVYISFMNVNDTLESGQEPSNVTWTFELNNAFGVKFFRGDRNVTERLIATQYVENIFERSTHSAVRAYCFNDHGDINVTYASDGENYVSLDTMHDGVQNITSFTLTGVSFVSKLRLLVSDTVGQDAGLLCTIYARGEAYSTSDDSAFWSIIDATSGNKVIDERALSHAKSQYISDDAKWIWNYNCSQVNTSCVMTESILFEFSFYNVHNPDNAPSFYFEWDDTFGDYMRFGFYNASHEGIAYQDNFDLLLEVGYVANFYSYDLFYDGYFGFHKKVFIDDVSFAIANDSYNVDWFVYMHIVNTTDPKPCFGYDVLRDKYTRITTRDLEIFSGWFDDGRSNWALNGNELPGWHNIKYLNLTYNSTYNKAHFPYFFHHPFVSNQKSWQRSFHIDDDITYDYVAIEFDVFTFCGWNHETDSVSVSLAFKEYLHFTTFWNSTHAPYDCSGYNSQTWDDALDIVRMNEDIHSDISCYAHGMTSQQHMCTLSIKTKHLQRKEDIPVVVLCDSYSTSNISITYAEDGVFFDHYMNNETQPNHITMQLSDVSRVSKLRIKVNNYMDEYQTTAVDTNTTTTSSTSMHGGLKCNIFVNDTVYFTNASDDYWSIIRASNDNTNIIHQNDTSDLTQSEAAWIWNEGDDDSDGSFVVFEFDFYHVFVQEYDLKYMNADKINITNGTNVTHISFGATPLTTCNLRMDIDKTTTDNITIVDGEVISSDTDSRLSSYVNSDRIDHMYINVRQYSYQCRLDLYTECGFVGNVTRIDNTTFQSSIHIHNASSWRLYAARGYECRITFHDSANNISFLLNAEDGNMMSETCDSGSTFDIVNISVTDVHYGCYTHVRFEAPNTNGQPFVLRIESEMDDISTKFGSYTQSWGWGNLSITPLICSSFSNIVPLKSPITLRYDDDPITLTSDELISLQHNYLFIVIDFDHTDYHIELYMLLGDSRYKEYYWNISISETDCKLENVRVGTVDYCEDNSNYYDLVNNITNNTHLEPLFWVSWDPFNMKTSLRTLSMGFGLRLHENVMASLNIYDDEFFDLHSSLDYVTFSGAKNDAMDVHMLAIQFAMPKLCLSQLSRANKYDIGNIWMDSCSDESGWELMRESYVIDNDVYYENAQTNDACPVTALNTNPVTKIASDCFHGPFTGSDYISRYLYVFSRIDYDIISVQMNYYSLCTWNPEENENDTAFVFINDHALWKSAPQYEFVHEYCQGYSLYADWSLYLEYDEVLNPDLIQCLTLLHQICAFPVTLNFRHRLEKEEVFFSVGIGAQLNQQIGNEAFGFSNVSISYTKCPVIEPLPIGDVIYQPLLDLNSHFKTGDMLVISAHSSYYLVAESPNNHSCTFTLHGGYTMWSQNSTNCTISGLPIMRDYPFSDYNTYDIGISDNGFLFLQNHETQNRLWSRRTPCEIDTAHFYYSMPKTNALGYYSNTRVSSIYSIDCTWALMLSDHKLNVIQNVTKSNAHYDGVTGDVVWSKGTNIKNVTFNEGDALVIYEYGDNQVILSPNGTDFMIFDAGKLVLIDSDTNSIAQQYDFEFANCTIDAQIGFIKYFYLMKPGDVLWNGEALISKDCQYKLMLSNGSLVLLNGDNEEEEVIWSAVNDSVWAERFEFLRDGNMVLYSYSTSNDILWQTNTSTFMYRGGIFYADRAILYDDGQLYIIDNDTLTPRMILFANKSMHNDIQAEYNENLLCDSSKYDYVDKRNGFYASYISYYNCENNEYTAGETTPCVAFTYCPVVERYRNVLLEPSHSSSKATLTNCQQYTEDYWKSFANDYILLQVSVKDTEISLEPQLSVVLTTSPSIPYGQEFDTEYAEYRTLLVTVSPLAHTMTLQTKYHHQSFYVSSLFDVEGEVEWVWIDWDVNFDTISIGNSKYIAAPIHTVKYSTFFGEKLNRDEDLFTHFNLAWDTKDHKCYGTIIVQFPPLNVKIPKGCYDAFNYTQLEQSTTPVPTTVEDANNTIESTSTKSEDDDTRSGKGATAIALIVGCVIAIAVISVVVLRNKNKAYGDDVMVETSYDVEHIKVDYVRMEDQDAGL